jgi:hypothetical protein
MTVIKVNDGLVPEASQIITGNGHVRRIETLNSIYNRYANLLLNDQHIILEDHIEKALNIGQFDRVMPNRRFRLTDFQKTLQRGNLQSEGIGFEYIHDYGPRSNSDPLMFGKELDEKGSYETVLLRLHNFLVFKSAVKRVGELKLCDTNELESEVIKEIHEEVMNDMMWTENNAIAFLHLEHEITATLGLDLATVRTVHPLTLLRLHSKSIIRKESNTQDELRLKLASEPKSEYDAELSRELLELILSTQMKSLAEAEHTGRASSELIDDHKKIRERMTEVVGLHAARSRMLERIMELQDEIETMIEMTGEEFDQLAEIQVRIHNRRV